MNGIGTIVRGAAAATLFALAGCVAYPGDMTYSAWYPGDYAAPSVGSSYYFGAPYSPGWPAWNSPGWSGWNSPGWSGWSGSLTFSSGGGWHGRDWHRFGGGWHGHDWRGHDWRFAGRGRGFGGGPPFTGPHFGGHPFGGPRFGGHPGAFHHGMGGGRGGFGIAVGHSAHVVGRGPG